MSLEKRKTTSQEKKETKKSKKEAEPRDDKEKETQVEAVVEKNDPVHENVEKEEKSTVEPAKKTAAKVLETIPFNKAFVNSCWYSWTPLKETAISSCPDVPCVSPPFELNSSELTAAETCTGLDLAISNDDDTNADQAQKEKVQVFQVQFNNQLVMKRADSNFWNISSVLRMLSMPKKKRKSIILKFKKYNLNAYQIDSGFYAFQGLWIDEASAALLCKQWNCYEQLEPLFNHNH